MVNELGEQRLLLNAVPWLTYRGMVDLLDGHHVRLTYDSHALELRAVSHDHEVCGHLVGRMVDVLTEELNRPVKGGGSTTLWRQDRGVGIDPDGCWWLDHERQVRGRDTIDLTRDPPPDLALDIQVTPSSLDRLAIYAALGVAEGWAYDGRSMRFYWLAQDGTQKVRDRSLAFPSVLSEQLAAVLTRRTEVDETTLVREFRAALTAGPSYG